MNIILLSGGSGRRLWPLSNEIRSKQFIKVFRRPDGELESMVQRVYRQIREAVGKDAQITIATSRSQVSSILNQLPEDVHVCVEPARRDTFPAVALACMYLAEREGVDPAEPVIVCPVDPYVEDDYFACLPKLYEMTRTGRWNLNLMGVRPTYPSEKYGYLVPEKEAVMSAVRSYEEKPDLARAQSLLTKGALWNCGIFAFRLDYLLARAQELLPYTKYQTLYDNYADCERISFDYAVGEKERSAGVLLYDKNWKDIGSWNTFAEEMHETVIGKGTLDSTSSDTNIVNELDIPILGLGLQHVIVAASNDGILVADKHQSSYMKPLVEKLDAQVRYAEKSWGSFTILDIDERALTIRIILMPGHRLHYHAHERRSEVWTVTEGEGFVIRDGERIDVRQGSVIELPVGCKHTIAAKTILRVIEVQIGEAISVTDKIKYPDPENIGEIPG
ncbi:MAG: cupin domain-containing protein [Lachnospiraceae bacterium]|nr:cupin domain-containing protein [Lachnospiraceae bacterium]